jgi:hypothetical protein
MNIYDVLLLGQISKAAALKARFIRWSFRQLEAFSPATDLKDLVINNNEAIDLTSA